MLQAEVGSCSPAQPSPAAHTPVAAEVVAPAVVVAAAPAAELGNQVAAGIAGIASIVEDSHRGRPS